MEVSVRRVVQVFLRKLAKEQNGNVSQMSRAMGKALNRAYLPTQFEDGRLTVDHIDALAAAVRARSVSALLGELFQIATQLEGLEPGQELPIEKEDVPLGKSRRHIAVISEGLPSPFDEARVSDVANPELPSKRHRKGPPRTPGRSR